MDPGVLLHQRPRPCVLLWLVPATCLCFSPPAFSQTPSSLILLQPLAEDRARVDVFSGANREFVRGRLLDVTDSMLVLEGRKGRTEMAAAEVREVWRPGGPLRCSPFSAPRPSGSGVRSPSSQKVRTSACVPSCSSVRFCSCRRCP